MAGTKDIVMVVDDGHPGRTVIPAATPLARLNYYDGKFLRAADLDLEQRYLMSLVALSNQGLGGGVVHGLSTAAVGGDQLEIGPGLAIDPQGHPLYLPQAVRLGIQDVIDASRPRSSATAAPDPARGPVAFSDCVDVVAPAPTDVLPAGDLYVIALCRAEAFCGQEDVYGAQCEVACVTGTERPLRLEGVVVRAIPLQLRTPFPSSNAVSLAGDAFLRSKVAHSFYADEVLKHPDSLSRDGLLSGVWCAGASYDASCCEVPLAVVSRGTLRFLDSWIARRERIDAPARRYWQWQLRQRPWSVFLAQVLQFQCQLAGVLGDGAGDGAGRDALTEAIGLIESMRGAADAARLFSTLSLSYTQLGTLQEKLGALVKGSLGGPGRRVLIAGGIVELPPAGYLPVVPGTLTVNAQVRALLGEGVDLRYCVVRPDFVGHAFEEAQHLDRISLLEGLDDPTRKPKVDVLVPDGVIVGGEQTDVGLYRADLVASAKQTGGVKHRGVAREAPLPGGGSALYLATAGVSELMVKKVAAMVQPFTNAKTAAKAGPVELQPDLATSTFTRAPMDSLLEARVMATVAANARAYAMHAAAAPAGAPAPAAPPPPAPAAAPGIAVGYLQTPGLAVLPEGRGDGLWLSLKSTVALDALDPGQQTDVTGSLILATFGSRPSSIEADFTGRLTATSVTPALGTQPRHLRAALGGVITLTLSVDDPPQDTETLFSFVKRFGGLVMDFDFTSQATALRVGLGAAGADLLVRREAPAAGMDVRYALAFEYTANGTTTELPLGELQLRADVTVVQPNHPNHQLAEQGLTIVQASRLVIDPTFHDTVRPLLFPALSPVDGGLTVQGVRDWVMFHRRREKQCTPSTTQVVQLPSRRYRVLQLTAGNEGAAKAYLARLTATDFPGLLAEAVKNDPGPPLVVEFLGGSPSGTFDPADVLKDWQARSPGSDFRGVAWGAPGDDDPLTQAGRLATLEAALGDQNGPSETRLLLSPFPAGVPIAGADGVVLFITLAQAKALHLNVLTPTIAKPASWLEQLEKLIATGTAASAAAADQLLHGAEPKFVGQVTFTGAAPDAPSLDQAVKAYVDAKYLTAGPFITWVAKADPDAALRIQHGELVRQAILQKLGQTFSEKTFVAQAGDPKLTALGPSGQSTVYGEAILLVTRQQPLVVIVAAREPVNRVVPGAPLVSDTSARVVLQDPASAPAPTLRATRIARVSYVVNHGPTAADDADAQAVIAWLQRKAGLLASATVAAKVVEANQLVTTTLADAKVPLDEYRAVVLLEY